MDCHDNTEAQEIQKIQEKARQEEEKENQQETTQEKEAQEAWIFVWSGFVGKFIILFLLNLGFRLLVRFGLIWLAKYIIYPIFFSNNTVLH